MSVVAPFGCLVRSKLGGNPGVYWGVHGTTNVTLPCSPSGSTSYLSPGGAATKAAVDLMRNAEAKERIAYAEAFAAAQSKAPAQKPVAAEAEKKVAAAGAAVENLAVGGKEKGIDRDMYE